MNDFLTEPRPEQYSTFGGNRELYLTVGLASITHDPSGLLIIPQVCLGIELGDEKFDLSIRWARDLANKMLEWCDIADKMNEGPW